VAHDPKTAFITGATGDIGSAITKTLVRDGFQKIAISGLEPDLLQEMTKELSSHSCEIIPFTVDLLNNEETDGLYGKVIDQVGPIQVLINNAGITRDKLILRMTDNDWESVLKVNLDACFRLCRAAAPSFLKQRAGRIINIASVVGFSGNVGQVNYCASKAGLIGFSKALALEMAPRGVTVNCVAPGFIDSAMTRALPEKVKDRLKTAIPLGRIGSPEDVAEVVAFLSSEKSSYITGATLHVNGGLYLG
jgi:3-oxoacyl-[acyl-carrier protein] reductase